MSDGFLLDSHVLVAIGRGSLAQTYPEIAAFLDRTGARLIASVASIWEIGIKQRLGKLDAGVPIAAFPEYLVSNGIAVLAVKASHPMMDVRPEPPTRDPFDRMLLAQCAVEGLRLVTVDRALVTHPLAWRLA